MAADNGAVYGQGRGGGVANAELLSKSHLTGTLNLFPDSCPHQACLCKEDLSFS